MLYCQIYVPEKTVENKCDDTHMFQKDYCDKNSVDHYTSD